MSTSVTPLAAFANGQAPTIEAVAKLLASDQIRKVVVLAGAGISTASGIPDFRSPDTGLYANLAKYQLPYPEAIFEIGYFQTKPQPFFQLAKELYPGNFAPTLTHYFLRLLDEKGKLLRVFTQNIDTLERLAGLSADKIVEAHGSFATSRCLRCKKEVDPQWIKDLCMKGEVAYCPEKTCQKRSSDGRGGLVKPDIVFFGEGLPDRFFSRLGDLKEADLLITMGTSLQVHPFASLIDRVGPTCPRLLINLERVGDIGSEDDNGGSFSLRGLSSMFKESGFDFDGLGVGKNHKQKIRDVFYKGRTDEGVRILARQCGWEHELDRLTQEKHKFATESSGQSSQTSEAKTPHLAAQQEAKKIAREVAEKDQESDAKKPASGVEELVAKVESLTVTRKSAEQQERKASPKEVEATKEAEESTDPKKSSL